MEDAVRVIGSAAMYLTIQIDLSSMKNIAGFGSVVGFLDEN